MLKILLYFSSGLILCGYIGYFLMILIGRGKKVSNSNGFDVTKEIISEYDSINVIESKKYFTVYNIRRKVIKLASNSYYGKDLSSISLSLIEAGISLVDNNKNKFINILKKIFPNLKVLYIFPLITLIINSISFTISDAKIGLILVVLFSVFTYIIIDIKTQVSSWISDNLENIKDINRDNSIKVLNFINNIILLDKFIFFGELLIIIRFVGILLEIG